MTGLFQRLRDKHVFRTALLYLGGAWAAMEAIGFFVDNYSWSRAVLDVAVLLLVLGFPATLIITWYHGEQGKQQLQRTEASLLLTLAVLAAIGTYRLSTAEVVPSVFDTSPSSVTAIDNPDLGERSVAVLPFVNNTGIDSLDWLGPGMSDMLTTNLAQSGALRVVSPQRLFELLRLAGRDETDRIPQELAMDIATQSGARAMIHGSILGTPEDLALDAQLIDLRDGTIIGAERARGSDVFALADSVARRLTGRLAGPDMRLARAPRAEPPAALTGDLDMLREFQTGLRNAWSKLETDSLEGRWQIADMLEEVPGREAEARRALEEIVSLDPEEPTAVGRLARIAIIQGDTEAADSLIEIFAVLEKDEVRALAGSGHLLEEAGRYAEARESYRAALALNPGNTVVLDHLARAHLSEGNPQGALDDLGPFTGSPDAAVRAEARLLRGDAYAWEGRFEDALASYRQVEAIGAAEKRPDLRTAGLESALYLQWIIDPEQGASRLNRSIWRLIELGRGDRAWNLVQAADRLFVKDADRLFPVDHHALLYAKGRVYELMGAPEAALEAYSELLRHWGDVIQQLPLLRDTPERVGRLQTS